MNSRLTKRTTSQTSFPSLWEKRGRSPFTNSFGFTSTRFRRISMEDTLKSFFDVRRLTRETTMEGMSRPPFYPRTSMSVESNFKAPPVIQGLECRKYSLYGSSIFVKNWTISSGDSDSCTCEHCLIMCSIKATFSLAEPNFHWSRMNSLDNVFISILPYQSIYPWS